MMNNTIQMHDFIGTTEGDKSHMLGKFLYFSLPPPRPRWRKNRA